MTARKGQHKSMLKSLWKKIAGKRQSGIFRTIEVNFEELADYASYMAASCRKVWATYRALDLIASTVQATRWTVRHADSAEPANVQELHKLLNEPNERETFADFIYRLTFHLKATGNAYAYKAEANLKGEKPRQLVLLNPRKVKISVDRNSGQVLGYLFRRDNGESVPFLPQEVIHWYKPHPNNEYYGLGDIEGGEELLQDFLNHQAWQKSFWRNGAAPSGILICEDVVTDEDEWERAKAKWQKEYGGIEKAGRTAWLSGKWRYEKLGLSGQEMQDLERSRLSVENIYLLHGVPLSVAGIREAANYATAEIDDDRFRRYTIAPLLRNIAETLTTDLVAGYGDYVFEFLQQTVNANQVVGTVVAAFDRGLLSVNEAREALGLQRDDDNPLWNQHFISAGLVPLELAGVPTNIEETGKIASRIVQDFALSSLQPVKRHGDNGNAT